MKRIQLFVLMAVLFCAPLAVNAQKNVNPRAEWFTDARFGMFIHWGVYSGAEGIWKGEKHRDDNNYAEWIQYRNRIEQDEYLTLLDRFDWESIDVEEWVILAKRAGMKYVTITSKHHDGFALWDSKVSEYDIGEFTNHTRDIVKELSDACKKHGLKFGLYYSHWIDWEHPGAWDHTKEVSGITPEEYDLYWQEKVIPQMRELLTEYGKVDMMWFDMWKNHSETCVTLEQLQQIKQMIRELQPGCLVNSRLGLSIEEDNDIDFKTLGDNQLGSTKQEFPWQSPATVAHSWGFNARERQWKSTTTLLQNLIGNASLNGNMMLNIGPRANGDVPYEIEMRLLQMGEWLEVNGESVYGSQAFDLVKDQHDWGKITCKQFPGGQTRLYLHLYNWPLNKQLPVTGIKDAPLRAYLLADKQQQILPIKHDQVFTQIELPALQPDPFVSVVVLEYDHYPEIEEGLVAKSVYEGFSLKPRNANHSEGSMEFVSTLPRGWVPAHMHLTGSSTFSWRIYIEQAGSFHADVSYNFQGEKASGKVRVSIAEQELEDELKPTGIFVGEPNQALRSDNYISMRVGTFEFSKPGFYDIQLEIDPGKGEVADFQWLWLEPLKAGCGPRN